MQDLKLLEVYWYFTQAEMLTYKLTELPTSNLSSFEKPNSSLT